jgi:nicotinate-nucleotide pyrophosphorylase (carboxylating)
MRRYRPDLPIEIEAQDLGQVDEAIAANVDTILLDNLSLEQIRDAVARAGRRVATEISGGVTLDRIPKLGATGAGFVSVGALTHSAPAIDISFELESI